MRLSELFESVNQHVEIASSEEKAGIVRTQRIHLSQLGTAMIAAGDDAQSIWLINQAVASLGTHGMMESHMRMLAKQMTPDQDVAQDLIEALAKVAKTVDLAVRGRDVGNVSDDVLDAADEVRILIQGLKAWEVVSITSDWDACCEVREAIADAQGIIRILDEMEDAEIEASGEDENEDPVIATLRTIESLVKADDAAGTDERIPSVRISDMTTDDILTSLTDRTRAVIMDMEIDAIQLIPVVDDHDETLMNPIMQAVLKIVYREEEDGHYKVSVAIDDSSGTQKTTIDLDQD